MQASDDAPPQSNRRVDKMFDEEDKKAEKKAQQGYMPLRVWQKRKEQLEVIVLDSSLEDAFAIREHNIQGSDGNWGNFERCAAESGEACACCKKFGDTAYAVLFLTVLVLKEWTSKKTNEKHAYSKMLLPMKRGQFKTWRKLEQIALKKHGTMRGMYLILEREDDPQSVATGVPVPLDDGTAFDLYDEDALVEEFGHGVVKNREGKVIKKENEDIEVFNYKKLFPEPDPAELRQRYGVAPEAGSKQSNAEAFKDDQDDDEIPMEHKASEPAESPGVRRRLRKAESAPEPSGPVRRRKRQETVVEDEYTEDDIPFK